MVRTLAAASVALASAGALAACAAIWGFQDAHDAADADTETPAEGANGVVCVPAPPAEWRGPLAIYEATGPDASLPDCVAPYGMPFDVHAGLMLPDVPNPATTCGCTCDPAVCTPPVVATYSDAKCATPCGAGSTSAGTTCAANYPPTGCAANGSAKITTPAALKSGSCASHQAPNLPPLIWGATARTCVPVAAVPGTCPAGKVPAPAAVPPFEINHCVAVSGIVDCPADYPAKRVYSAESSDQRQCRCACGPPIDCTKGTTVGWDMGGATCAGAMKDVTSTCVGMGNTSALVYTQPDGGGCAPTGAIDGTATAGGPTTVCCRR